MRQSSILFFEALHKSRENKDNAVFLMRYGRLVGINKVLRQRRDEIRERGINMVDPGAMDAAADMREE